MLPEILIPVEKIWELIKNVWPYQFALLAMFKTTMMLPVHYYHY
jgi:hypothetical protein